MEMFAKNLDSSVQIFQISKFQIEYMDYFK